MKGCLSRCKDMQHVSSCLILTCTLYILMLCKNLLKVPGTNFSLCVVLGKHDQQRRLQEIQELLVINGNVFFYHRLDLNTIPTQKCREYDRYSTKGAYY